MKRNSLGWWLATSNVLIVLLVTAGISYFAVDMLRDLGDDQQKVRVQLAGANSRQEITRLAEKALNDVRVLAAKPEMRRLVNERARAGLPPVLRRFCDRTSSTPAWCSMAARWSPRQASSSRGASCSRSRRSRETGSWRCRWARSCR